MAGGGMGGTNSSISGTSSAFGSPGGGGAQFAVMPSNQPSQTYLQQPPSQTSPPMQNMMQRQPMQQFFNPFNPYGGMGGSFNPYTNQMQQPFNPYGGMGGGFNPYAPGGMRSNPYGGFGNQFGGFQGGKMGGPFGGGFGSPFGGGMGSPFYGGGFGSPGGFQNREMPQPAVMPNITMEPTFDMRGLSNDGGQGQRQAFPSAMLVPAAQGYENYQYQPGSGRLGQIPPGMQSGLASLLRGFR